ncbi:MAG: zinc-dependent metalloprotease, partial [Acidobacteriota bacterium]
APEPIRSALVEGASWWNQAFEAAGFRNAFQVKVLPEDADPMDVRYNMINWVHRSTRGWSYGGSIEDPRTGEILKGNVTLGSLRIRQDFTIGSGLVPIFADASRQGGDGFSGPCEAAMLTDDEELAALDPSTDPEAMSLARIRQLAAHEVGHTLGFAHNFAASTYGRASVLDYPAPWVEIKNGKLDLSNAYATGIGDYDKFAVQYSYTQFAAGTNEDEALEKLVEGGVAKGYLFLTDQDARPEGAANPLATLWDNGADAVETLKHEMEVRRIGLGQFGLNSVPEGTPLAMLEAKLLPLYLHHRYQLNAAIKTIGGVYYTHSVKTKTGPNPPKPVEIIPAAKQKEALDEVLNTIDPESLKIPERILDLIPPPAPGFGRGTLELFEKRTDPIFDPLSAASLAADLTVSGLLQHERAARMTTFHSRNAEYPAFADVVNALLKKAWTRPPDAYGQQIARTTQWLIVSRLMDLASNADAMPQVRATATNALRNIVTGIGTANDPMKDEIDRFLKRPDPVNKKTDPLPTPAGDPIGGR